MTTQTKGRRFHITTPLMKESLLDKDVVRETHGDYTLAMMPDLNMVMVGGLSVFDRGRACLPLVDEIGALAQDEGHKILVGVGPGWRARHLYKVGIDLGLSAGCLAQLVWQGQFVDQHMLVSCLARYGGVELHGLEYLALRMFMGQRRIPVACATPAHHIWEPPPRHGDSVSEYGSDYGFFVVGDALGARSLTLVKDVDGLYTADPKKHPDAEFIPRIGAHELLKLDLETLPFNRTMVESLRYSRLLKQVRLINGLVPGNLARAMSGEDVGTLVTQDEE